MKTRRPVSLVLPDTYAKMRIVNAQRRRGKTANVIGMVEGGRRA